MEVTDVISFKVIAQNLSDGTAFCGGTVNISKNNLSLNWYSNLESPIHVWFLNSFHPKY